MPTYVDPDGYELVDADGLAYPDGPGCATPPCCSPCMCVPDRPWMWPMVAGSCTASTCQYAMVVLVTASGSFNNRENMAPCPGLQPINATVNFSLSETIAVTLPRGLPPAVCPQSTGTAGLLRSTGSGQAQVHVRPTINWQAAGALGGTGVFGAPRNSIAAPFGMLILDLWGSYAGVDQRRAQMQVYVPIGGAMPAPGWAMQLSATASPGGTAPGQVFNPGTVTPGPLNADGFRTGMSGGGQSVFWQSAFAQCNLGATLSIQSWSAQFGLVRACGTPGDGGPEGDAPGGDCGCQHAPGGGGDDTTEAIDAMMRGQFGKPCTGCG